MLKPVVNDYYGGIRATSLRSGQPERTPPNMAHGKHRAHLNLIQPAHLTHHLHAGREEQVKGHRPPDHGTEDLFSPINIMGKQQWAGTIRGETTCTRHFHQLQSTGLLKT